ncbi:hypothetical protein ANCCEY_14519 [Ancylostoma ceylanicum]|uniref:Uncharacterized protein n=1 Tax=Ancylostoma ceylanicum TaxID=53326 RepID=A0A0D6L5E7_9BILA|nr:hypothetical protein ANCCEY_14519 [Ancylostoma ceylanicum]
MQQDVLVGVTAAVVSAITYGSTYVPVRWFEAGDGLFFQWMMCIGQALIGTVVLAISGWPPVFPLAMLSGVFFAVGNALTVYIMDGIGMAVGSLLWNTITCVMGWAVTRFGILGNPQQLPHNNVMNFIGVIVVCVGRNRPFINPELTLPSLTSGMIYAVATYCFFLANQHLDQTIAYPILSKAPGVVVSLWAVFLFNEIKGCRDLTALVVGICTTITGIALISVSKIQF